MHYVPPRWDVWANWQLWVWPVTGAPPLIDAYVVMIGPFRIAFTPKKARLAAARKDEADGS